MIFMIPNSISEKWTHFLYWICVFAFLFLIFDIVLIKTNPIRFSLFPPTASAEELLDPVGHY